MLFFTSDVVQPPALIFMGDDKHENEELIRWGWPEDVWFHVDKVRIFCFKWDAVFETYLGLAGRV